MNASIISLRKAASAALASLTLLAAPAAEAGQLLVNWGGNYVSTDRSSAASQVLIDNAILYSYSESTAKSPAASSYSGVSDLFYGAVQLSTREGASGSPQFRVQNQASNDRIYIRSQDGASGSPANVKGLIFWKKDNFLNGFSSSTLSLGQLSELQINLPDVRGTNATIRFAVQMNNIWYVSEAARQGTFYGTSMGSFVLNNPQDGNWAEWSVQNTPNGEINSGPSAFSVDGSVLTDITAVGFFFDVPYAGSNAAWIGVDSFTAKAIPEPSHMALLGLSSILLVRYTLKRAK